MNTQGKITITETVARKFKSDGCTAFTLVDGCLVGKTPANGKKVEYAIPALPVVKAYISEANRQDLETVIRLAQERLAA